MTYLDYMSTTPIDNAVAAAMQQYMCFDVDFANASSQHEYGKRAYAAVELARTQVATLVNADPREIIWTSGATESNNMALLGAARFYARSGRHIISVKTEHAAVLKPLQALESEGFAVTLLEVDKFGCINLNDLISAIRQDTILISVMHVNNETGVIHDIQAIGEIAKANGIKFHVDAAQSAGKIAIDLQQIPVDLMSLSAHKNYGPKGIGTLFVRQQPRVRLSPIMYGGAQEWGMRAGTLATQQIVGMGAAFALAAKTLVSRQQHIIACEKILREVLLDIAGVSINGHPDKRYRGCVNIAITGVKANDLIASLPHIAMSQGAACSLNPGVSHVLTAMGMSHQQILESVRLSVGLMSSLESVLAAAQQLQASIARLR